VVDGGSEDATHSILSRYKDRMTHCLIESDDGLYDALNKGFERATGEIMGWLNADDLLHRESLQVIAEVFHAFPEVEWVTGIPTNVDACGRFHESSLPRFWNADLLLEGTRGAPQQESTFWRRSLWERAGGKVDTHYRYAADFELWTRFFKYTNLVTLHSFVAGFRKHDRNLSHRQKETYNTEKASILEREDRHPLRRKLRIRMSRWFPYETENMRYHHGEQKFVKNRIRWSA